MAFVDKRALLKPKALKREKVTVGDGDDFVLMRELTVAERLYARKRFVGVDQNDEEEATVAVLALVVSSLCNDDEEQTVMFQEFEWDEAVQALLQLSNAEVENLMAECLRIQGMGEGAQKDAVKNSEASPSDSSSSGSPKTSDTPVPES